MNKVELIDNIPKNWTEFISFTESVSDNCYFVSTGYGLCIDEVEVANKQFLIEININRKTITFVDNLTLFDDEGSELPKEPVNKLVELARKNNMDFYDRGDGNDGYHWYGLQIEAEQFNYYELESFVEAWYSYNKSVETSV